MVDACCGPAHGCVFAKAILARAADCSLARRRSVGERELLECPSPVAHTNCETLAALMHERARFALRLPRPEQPLMHAQAMRLQCGGLAGLQRALTGGPGLSERVAGPPGGSAANASTADADADGGDGDLERRARDAAAGAPSASPPAADVHALIGLAQARHGSLTALPWDAVVAAMREWAPRRRRAPSPTTR